MADNNNDDRYDDDDDTVSWSEPSKDGGKGGKNGRKLLAQY